MRCSFYIEARQHHLGRNFARVFEFDPARSFTQEKRGWRRLRPAETAQAQKPPLKDRRFKCCEFHTN
jgi:hypothetical protein